MGGPSLGLEQLASASQELLAWPRPLGRSEIKVAGSPGCSATRRRGAQPLMTRAHSGIHHVRFLQVKCTGSRPPSYPPPTAENRLSKMLRPWSADLNKNALRHCFAVWVSSLRGVGTARGMHFLRMRWGGRPWELGSICLLLSVSSFHFLHCRKDCSVRITGTYRHREEMVTSRHSHTTSFFLAIKKR